MLDIKDIEKLAQLSRIRISPEEKEKFFKDIDSILEYIGQIKEASSAGSLDQTSFSASAKNVLREDESPHKSGEFTDALVKEAPFSRDGYIKVKKIL